MGRHIFIYLSILSALTSSALPEPTTAASTAPPAPAPAPAAEPRADEAPISDDPDGEDAPEGYYAFVESPNATPPRVRPPPYRKVDVECPEAADAKPHVTAHNLCGDLNRGDIPRNPMGQNPEGEPYPFQLIRNHTLRFLSRALPALRNDESLPRVAHLPPAPHPDPALYDLQNNRLEERSKRSLQEASAESGASDATPARLLRAEHRAADNTAPRESRKFCDGGGVFCMLYRAINGDSESTTPLERREDPGTPVRGGTPATHPHHRYDGPPTPCPARVEYATPVFARNYQGVWRYVVQIPYEGYFTQTVEVTRCMQSRCHYLEGGCLSSPRWVSLLVAEMHYPRQAQVSDFQEYQQFLQKRAGAVSGAGAGAGTGAGAGGAGDASGADKAPHCDGHDNFGCFQVRLYYDWFLVPGSCKCWRPDYFARYVRRRHNNEL